MYTYQELINDFKLSRLPPSVSLETVAILKKTASAHRYLYSLDVANASNSLAINLFLQILLEKGMKQFFKKQFFLPDNNKSGIL
jgi:hypothetical protein